MVSTDDEEPPTPRPFLEYLDSQVRDLVFDRGHVRKHREGFVLFREGDSAGPVVVILEGRLKITKVAMDGREVILELRGAGDILGELACIDGHPRSATAQFLTPGSALHLSGTEFIEMVETVPAVGAAALRTVVHRLRAASGRQLEFGTSDATTRVARRLIELMEPNQRNPNEQVSLRSPVSQNELAEWCGLSRDAVVRALRTLRELGWVDTARQRFTILRPEELRRRALVGDETSFR